MAISAQDKMLYVANKLGLTSLKDMQGSTRVVYDQITTADGQNYNGAGGSGISVKFDLVIGNKTVIKDCVVESAGQQAFYNDSGALSSVLTLEGVGILIPPQVEFYVRASPFDNQVRVASSQRLGCYLFGTAALLNFNTTI
jgi:hypothetical protein